MPERKLRLAVVGCGAIAERGHIPAARRVGEVRLVALVDSDTARAEALARRFGVPRVAATLSGVAAEVDAAILATPPHVRPALAEEAFREGLHVLCEKPLANTTTEAEAILRAAARARRVLAVAHTYRFFPNRIRLYEMLGQGVLGGVRRIDVREGMPAGWPTRSGYPFRKEMVPGGVLLTLGIHSLDALFWWFGEPFAFQYEDDSVGGLESNARIRMHFAGEVEASVRLSRTCRLENRMTVEGERGALSVPVYDQRVIHQCLGGKEARRVVERGRSGLVHVVAEQLRDFARSITEQRAPRATGADGLRVVQFIEGCYAAKRARPLPEQAPIAGFTW
ncbi:MAG TPA: Gfo/Idh/MocA family oxidoreductase [Armatimonadota bacterium]|jgi:predicted dehydrogenase|nr:Gfo/Idh/MocA family oxidoreductase [Armatimonadota bacterium]HOJ23132.1 Gfo/Idh/MocA family oxidoreductase [Armatimonadota bacterium]HOM80858.1 Gfo/Idh/MocA family oxidoreductase [Armatimonadota bacterium]HPO72269.1 Gfo/Idh/MocA family oxidoreductase [Armatimonadota bacterium]HPT97377.1 Gfo/Idh/MocA family oxidoreductase [Armatimonadota bacterium]